MDGTLCSPSRRHGRALLITPDNGKGVGPVGDRINTVTTAFGEVFGYTNCHIVSDGAGRAVIVDPGQGAMPWVLGQVRDRGLSVHAVLLTHGHMDHTWDAQPLADALDVPLMLHRAGHHCLLRPEAGLPAAFPPALLDGHPRTLPRELLHPPESFMAGDLTIRAIETPGHTPCSVSYLITSEQERVLCTGDLLLGGGQVGRPIPPGGNLRALESSVQRLLPALTGTLLLPGHGDPYTVTVEA